MQYQIMSYIEDTVWSVIKGLPDYFIKDTALIKQKKSYTRIPAVRNAGARPEQEGDRESGELHPPGL